MIDNVEEATKAKEAIKQLFEFEHIERVICVDDNYTAVSAEVIVALYQTIDRDKLQNIQQLQSIVIIGNMDVEIEQVKKHCNTLEYEDKAKLYSELLQLIPDDTGSEQGDTKSTHRLAELLDGFGFIELSPKEWSDRGSEFLKDDKADRTIFLFDQDLSKGGGTEEEGIKIVQNIYREHGERIICGLLSHTFTPDQEFDRWQELTTSYEIDPHSIVLISKQHLQDSLFRFVHMIKLTVLSRHCKRLKEVVSENFSQALKSARSKIEKINVYDFDHIVFRLSYHEGIWEPETLLRVFELFHKVETLKTIKSNEEVVKLTNKIRSVSHIAIDVEKPKLSSWKIQRQEIYGDYEYLRDFHLPIELGDIFEEAGSGKKYILLAQPCDLMVRPNGRRKASEAIVAEIIGQLPADKPNLQEAHYELEYFDKETGKSVYVNFRKTFTIWLWILDLCVYSENGLAKLTVGEAYPDAIIPSWKNRYEKEIQKKVKQVVERYNGFSQSYRNKVSKETLNFLIPKSSLEGPFKGNIDEKSLSYDCKRVGRLWQPRSTAMLTKFASYLARAAFDVDFGRGNDQD